jgi:hypothetical protein
MMARKYIEEWLAVSIQLPISRAHDPENANRV